MCLVRNEACQKAGFAHKDLSGMSTSVLMAKEMEGQLGTSPVL